MKLYLASRYQRRDELRTYAEQLRSAGIEVCSSWVFNHDGHELDHDLATDEQRRFYADRDLHDLNEADMLVLFTPAGRHGGSTVEFGYAVAAGANLIVIGPRENVFHYLESVNHFDSFTAFFTKLIEGV